MEGKETLELTPSWRIIGNKLQLEKGEPLFAEGVAYATLDGHTLVHTWEALI